MQKAAGGWSRCTCKRPRSGLGANVRCKETVDRERGMDPNSNEATARPRQRRWRGQVVTSADMMSRHSIRFAGALQHAEN